MAKPKKTPRPKAQTPKGFRDYFGAEVTQRAEMLSKIAEFYEDEVDIAVAGLVKLLEPLMIVVLGVIIGIIVTAMYLPLYTILGSIA